MAGVQFRGRLFIAPTDLELSVEEAIEVLGPQHANQHRFVGDRIVESQFGLLVMGKTSRHGEIKGAAGKGRRCALDRQDQKQGRETTG